METQTSETIDPTLAAEASHYEALRRQHISDLLARMPENVKRVKWPVERVREERQRRLRSLIRVAKEKSPWHGERLGNVDADSITEADLGELPVMTKADLMANFDQIITDKRLTLEMVNAHVSNLREDRYLLDEYHVIASGGTSGFRGVFVYNWDEWITAAMSAMRVSLLSVNPLLWRLLSSRPIGKVVIDSKIKRKKARKPGSKAKIVGVMADIASHFTYAMANSLAYPFVDAWFPATLSIPEIVDGLNMAQPDNLSAYSSVLYRLALEAKAGKLHIAPKRISSSSEPLFPYIRDAVRDVWGLSVANVWGASEGGMLACGCGKGEGMHLNEDMHIIEPVDENGRPVPPGVRASKLYLTNLFNHTLPLIRYEISDQVRFLDGEPCSCESTLRRVEDVQGRLEDVFTYEGGGVAVHPLVFWSTFQHYPNVVEYQVRQTEHGVVISLLTNGPVAVEQVERDVGEYLEKLGLHKPEVSARIAGNLERTPGAAKLKRFVPLANA